MKSILIVLVILITCHLQGQQKKTVAATKIDTPMSIDGSLNEPVYSDAVPARDFVQIQPYNGRPSMQATEVYLFYDNASFYVGAIMYDRAPDSIYNFLSERDQIGMSDYFGIYFDPYNQGQVAYGFFITPAGVQTDLKAVKGDWDYEDPNWNAVWQSKTRISEQGWIAEMRIPFSSLRFPGNGGGTWGLNMFRNIRRYTSNNTWNRVDLTISGIIHQEGEMTGISDIKPPVRLSLSPFSALYTQLSPNSSADLKFKGGLDLKYGISESFTLDMMLIPDFGQIQSDDKKLNLTPYELYYSERRQFFTEGTELFNRAGIFYSKRIGSSPKFSGKIYNEIGENEVVSFSPSETQLLNATKISGRTRKGLGIGLLNAVTLPSFTILYDTIADARRRVMVQPLTNYNVSVIDRSLKNNSFISLINTSMLLANDPFYSNVTGTDFQLRNKAKTFSVRGKGGISIRNQGMDETGYFSSLGIEKNSGKLQFGVSANLCSDSYNPNDMGYLQKNNEFHTNTFLRYSVREPFWIFREVHQYLSWDHNRMYRNFKFSGNEVFLNSYSVFKNNYALLANLWITGDRNDFYEPRTEGMYYTDPHKYTLEFGVFTDHRKPLYMRLIHRTVNSVDNEKGRGFFISGSLRGGKKFQLHYSSSINNEKNKRGFAGSDGTADSVFFASRNIKTIENALGSSFTFNNRSGVTLRVRHYVSSAENRKYYLLNNEGRLDPYSGIYNGISQTYNILNVDFLFRWIFAPGSELCVAWKKSVFDNRHEIIRRYGENLRNIFDADQCDSFSLKVLYYIDYNSIRRK